MSEQRRAKLQRAFRLMMLSGVYTALAISPVGARLASTLPVLRDPNPVHYVSAFHNPFAQNPATGHYVVTMPR